MCVELISNSQTAQMNNESIWQLEEEAAVVLSPSLQINLNCYLFCNHLNKALYSPEPCPPSKQRFSPSSPVLFCYPLQLFFCPYREYGCCLGCLIYFRCYILDVIRSFFFFFFSEHCYFLKASCICSEGSACDGSSFSRRSTSLAA